MHHLRRKQSVFLNYWQNYLRIVILFLKSFYVRKTADLNLKWKLLHKLEKYEPGQKQWVVQLNWNQDAPNWNRYLASHVLYVPNVFLLNQCEGLDLVDEWGLEMSICKTVTFLEEFHKMLCGFSSNVSQMKALALLKQHHVAKRRARLHQRLKTQSTLCFQLKSKPLIRSDNVISPDSLSAL